MRRKRVDPRSAFHYLAEDDEDEQALEDLSGCGRKVTVVVDSRAAENVMPRSMFPEIFTEEKRGARVEKGSKDPEDSTSRITGSKSLFLRTSERFVRKSTWHVADVRRRQHPTSSKPGAMCSSGRMKRTS